MREATSATRRTASVSAAESTVAVAEDESGSSERYFGNSPSEQPGRRSRWPPDSPAALTRAVARQRERHLGAGRQRLRRLGQGAGRHQRGRLHGWVDRRPSQCPDREAVPVGGRECHLLTVDLDPDAGEDRQRVVAAGGDRHGGDGRRERVAAHCPGDLGHGRQRRVLIERQASAA